jgi:serine/threonine protein kinase
LFQKKVGPEDFEPLRVVGRGSFAKVMLVRKIDTGRTYAMKVIKKDSVIKHNAVKHTLSERNVLMRINNPFIVSLKYSFQTDDKLYMILDYIAGGIY